MTTRKVFLVAGAAADGSAATACASDSAAKEPFASFAFDQARFASMLGKPARHRQCFGAAQIAGGDVLRQMLNSMNAYEYTLKEGSGAMHAAAVLYHGHVVALGMNDRAWNELVIPAIPKMSEPMRKGMPAGLKPGSGNPYWHESKIKSPQYDASIEALVLRRASFFICNNALVGTANVIATALGKHQAEVYKQLAASTVPGSLLVPAGVMAINACQDARFTYIQATL
ncbi:MAG: hypothetical protein ABI182_05490 [Candidatus Baltobacteraceae bacterium]